MDLRFFIYFNNQIFPLSFKTLRSLFNFPSNFSFFGYNLVGSLNSFRKCDTFLRRGKVLVSRINNQKEETYFEIEFNVSDSLIDKGLNK